MILFKKNKIFQQFIPLVLNYKQLPLPEGYPKHSGIVRVYMTDWDDADAVNAANELNLPLVKSNSNAEQYAKVEQGYDVVMVYNKIDKSIMIAVSRKNK